MNVDRRRFVGSAAGMAATAGVAADWLWPKHSVSYRRRRSFVAILNAAEYSEKIEALLMDGLRLFRLNLLGKTVLLKPNLVEDLPGPVNTNANIIGAAARCFLRLGATRVVIGEGPGHQRDTELVVQAADLKPHLADRRIEFVDLNRDELVRSEAEGELQRPRRAMVTAHGSRFDFVVSMPKVKTHHWAGVTLSLKNMFGIVPGMKYGWPKNLLHWHGIHESILDICATVPIHFVIADGITAMEGNGPLQGTARELGRIVLADDPVAADATCARLMGFDPLQVRTCQKDAGSSAICAPTGSRCWPNGRSTNPPLCGASRFPLPPRADGHVTLPVESREVPRGRLRQSSGMSKSGSSLLICMNAHVAGRQLPEPVTRCERNEENWVHPKEKRPTPGSVVARSKRNE